MLHRFRHSIASFSLPTRLNNPFHYTPHPLCELAARELRAYLCERKEWTEELSAGKMFGVLVVKDPAGTVGFLAAFSGNLAGSNSHEYFVPPIYDMLRPGDFFRTEEASISDLNRQIETLETAGRYRELLRTIEETETEVAREIAAAKARMRIAKTAREARRREHPDENTQTALVRESQYEKAELHRLKQSWKNRLASLHAQRTSIVERIESLRCERKARSAALQAKLFRKFRLLNALGEIRDLAEIFATTPQRTPPAGAGECAAPKLLQYAFEHRLTPLAIAEFWWGASPKGEIRRHGHYYPACRGKCGPILAHMLRGLDVEPEPDRACPQAAPELLYEDRWIAAVFKPAGMLSVPGKSEAPSVLDWARERYPAATGPLVVHRLDMDTSGVLLLALTKEAHQELQAQFKHRTVRKRYIALLEGRITPPKGRIELPPATGPPRPSPTGGRSPARKTGDHGVRSVGIPERPHPHRLLPADRPHAPVARPCGPSIGTQCSDRGRPTVRNSRPAIVSACRTDRIPPSGDRRSDSDRKTGGFLMSQEKADASRSPLFPPFNFYFITPTGTISSG